jgi:hypothetical protein
MVLTLMLHQQMLCQLVCMEEGQAKLTIPANEEIEVQWVSL